MQQEQWESRYRSERVWSGDPNPWLIEAASSLQPGTALDVGCGEGADTLWLAERGWRVTGLDFAPSALKVAAAHAEERGLADLITWTEADIRSWRSEEQFDLVSVHFLHGPASERRQALARAWALTGQVLLVVAHDTTNATQGHGGPPADVLYSASDVLNDLGVEAGRVDLAERRARHADDPERIMWDCVVQLSRS